MTARTGSPAPSDTISCPFDTHISPQRAPEIFPPHGEAAHPRLTQQGQASHMLEKYCQAWQHIPCLGSIGTPLFKQRNEVTHKKQVELETTAPGRCWWSGIAHPPEHQLTGEGGTLDARLQPSTTQAILFHCSCPPSTRKLSECSRSQFKRSLKCRNFPYCEIVF